MFKTFLLALCTAFFSLHASAADSAIVGGTEYRLASPSRVILSPGEEQKVKKDCVTETSVFTETTSCAVITTVSATATDIVVTEESSSRTTSWRNEMLRTALAIALMVLAVVLVNIKFVILAFYVLLVALLASLGAIAAMLSIQAYVTASIVLFATCACLLGIATLNSRRNLPTFYWSAYVHVILMLVAAAVVW